MTTDVQILSLACDDRPGLVAEVAGLIARARGNILEAQQYDDIASARFFMRVVFTLPAGSTLGDDFARLASAHAMRWRLRPATHRPRVLLLVSRFDHCLADLLYRHRIGELAVDIAGVVSNHAREVFAPGLLGDAPFHHVPVSAATKLHAEARLRAIVDDTGSELVVLARYMQVLSSGMAAWLSGRCINIHHSFLPGFKGAKPYHQAHERGVKMIGATAHYVTDALDEGPIIHQDVAVVSHADTPDDLIRKGRDVERRVLATAVRYHVEDRVLLNGAKTVVFAD